MGACHSNEATEPQASNMQPTPSKDTAQSTAPSANPQSVVPMYVPPPGAWTPEIAEEKRRAKIAEINRQQEIERQRATAHLRQKSSSKHRRSSKHQPRQSLSTHTNKPADIERTEHSAIPSTDSVLKAENEMSIRSTLHESPSGSAPRELNAPATNELSGNERRARAGSLQSTTTPSLTRETSRVESRSSNDQRIDKTPRKSWNYDALPGERGEQVRPRHNHSQSISHPASAPSTPPQKRRTTYGESVQLQAVEEVSVLSIATPKSNIDTTPKPSVIAKDQSPATPVSPLYQGVKLRSAPVTPRSSVVSTPRVQCASPTASDASAVFGVKLRKTTSTSPASSTPVTTVTATVA